jgi:hypothetical protein
MNALPQEAMILLSVLPFLGLGILAVVLVSLGSNRDRYILPGVLAVVLAVSSWGAAQEYGPRVQALLNKPTVVKNDVTPPTEEDVVSDDADKDNPPPAKTDRAGDVVKKEAPEVKKKIKDDSSTLVPKVDDDKKGDDKKSASNEPFRRREVHVNPSGPGPLPDQPETAVKPEVKPGPKPEVKPAPRFEPPPAPKPEPPPTPKPIPPAPPKPEPPPMPKPEVKPPPTVAKSDPLPVPADKPAPKLPDLRETRSSGGSGPGTLTIKLAGTIVENSSQAGRAAHLLVIVDGRQVEVRPPSSTKESYVNNDPSKGLQGVLYTWEGLTLTFKNLDPGFHFVMIDTSMDSPASHQASMLGGGKDENDYNGTIEIKPGESAVMEFGNKNVISGKLQRRR